MAMTDEEWAQYQLEGKHLREDQRTEAMKTVTDAGETSVSDRQLRVLSECRDLLKSIKGMLLFFTVLIIIGLIVDVFRAFAK